MRTTILALPLFAATLLACSSTPREASQSTGQKVIANVASMVQCPADNTDPSCPAGSFSVSCTNGTKEVDPESQVVANEVCPIALDTECSPSLGQQEPVTITFVNNEPFAVDLYWVDYQCNEVHYAGIDANGGTLAQETYEGHVWQVRNASTQESVLDYRAPFDTTLTTVDVCEGSQCDCPAGQLFCGTACVDPSTDSLNCGACGAGCGPAQTCSAGECEGPVSPLVGIWNFSYVWPPAAGSAPGTQAATTTGWLSINANGTMSYGNSDVPASEYQTSWSLTGNAFSMAMSMPESKFGFEKLWWVGTYDGSTITGSIGMSYLGTEQSGSFTLSRLGAP